MKRLLQVALLIETSNGYARGLLEGVRRYLREHDSWSVYISEHGRGDSVPRWLRGWRGDGILARIENRRIAGAVADRNLPTVDLSAARLLPKLPWVETDDAAIARQAFDHLFERGFRHLGFCGLKAFNWSTWRGENFRRLAKEAGCDCAVRCSAGSELRVAEWAQEHRQLTRWIGSLPKPVGIFACYDLLGRRVLDACRSIGVRVPDEVAVVGVDDDPLICELADPPLSSVIPDTSRTGYRAAEMLAQLMRNEKVGTDPHLIPPLGVAARKSTDALAIEDQLVSSAVRFIREHAFDGIGISQLLESIPSSRRVLEGRFKEILGRTPHQEIVRVQMEKVRELLRSTDLPLKAIARRVGISRPEYLNVAFKREVGMPPGEYRRKHQLSANRSPA